MREGARATILLSVPWPLFYWAFHREGSVLVSMAAASSALCVAGVALYPRALASLKLDARGALEALASSAALYAVFVGGALASRELGLGWQVEAVYGRLAGSAAELALVPAVGVAEELYWRGALQRELLSSRLGLPWWVSSIFYAAVHVVSSLVVLVPAALLVGLVLGLLAQRRGVGASSLSHALWLYAVLYVAPVRSLLG